MQPSGQYIQHNRHLLHFSLFNMGRKVRQKPVFPMPPTLGRERGVTSILVVDFFANECHRSGENNTKGVNKGKSISQTVHRLITSGKIC